MALHFELEIIALEDGTFKAKVGQMPIQWHNPEALSHTFSFDFNDITLKRQLATLSGVRDVTATEEREIAKTFGIHLFKTVFGGEIAAAYQASLNFALAEEETLRLQLVLNLAGKMADLPWEFLHNERDFLALSRSTPIIHYPRQISTPPPVTINAPINILVMLANPTDFPPLDIAQERKNLEEATSKLRTEGLIAIDFLEEATLLNLQRKLREKEYHIFHYIGHSGYDEVTGVGWLALEDQLGEGSAVRANGESFARELAEETTIRLVVMNSCHGARQSDQNPAGGIASSLVTRGIPAVVANQFAISNEAATIFAQEFYTAIAEGLAIDPAFSEARRAVSGSLNNIEWATPVLYLRSTEDFLFRIRPVHEAPNYRNPYIWGAVGLLGLLIFFGVLLATRGDDGGDADSSPTPIANTDIPTDIPAADVQIKSIDLSTNRPVPGDIVTISILVENLGPGRSSEITLEFLGDDQNFQTIFVSPVRSLDAGESQLLQLPYRYTWFGAFISRALLDPDNLLADPNRRNNIRTLPVITRVDEPFVVNFSDALPIGTRITLPEIMDANTFDLWGFRMVVIPNEACPTAVPWFKVAEDGTVALGTGLPEDMNTCADLPLAVTLLEQRDVTQEGTTAITAIFAPSTGTHLIRGFTDRERQHLFGDSDEVGNGIDPTVVELWIGVFDRANLLSAEISTTGGELLITELSFGAP